MDKHLVLEDCHNKLTKTDDDIYFGMFGPIKLCIVNNNTDYCSLQWGIGEATVVAVQSHDSWIVELRTLADILEQHKKLIETKRDLFKQ